MKFADLFAGLGGFHLALSRLGHECVFACEIDDCLREVYFKNFDVRPVGDIRHVAIGAVPRHDILCAGFPCQPFSKAGEQQGLDCPRWGGLFEYVLQIIRHHRPSFLILENVANLERHDQGKTWNGMSAALRSEGYTVDARRFSPHEFGIPQVRDRFYIVASQAGLGHFSWPEPKQVAPTNIRRVLSHRPPEARPITRQMEECLDTWQEFVRRFPLQHDLPSWPIWAMEFGATYPYEERTPFSSGSRTLARYRGSFGRPLGELPPSDRLGGLPVYARTEELVFPRWKVNFIRHNRAFYAEHREWIDPWLPAVRRFPPSLQKLEWNCKGGERDVWQHLIQFRASGVRVKRPTHAPSLVAMTTTQVPIVSWERRYMTPRECARLQSLSALQHLPPAQTRAFKALGNAVNVNVVGRIAKALLGAGEAIPTLVRSERHRA